MAWKRLITMDERLVIREQWYHHHAWRNASFVWLRLLVKTRSPFTARTEKESALSLPWCTSCRGNIMDRLRSRIGSGGIDSSGRIRRIQQVVGCVASRSRSLASIVAIGSVGMRRSSWIRTPYILHVRQPPRRVGHVLLLVDFRSTSRDSPVRRIDGKNEKIRFRSPSLLTKRFFY